MAAIRDLSRLKFFCNLTRPLIIMGALATGESQQMFADLMRKYMSRPHDFGSSQYILKIVEECWRRRAQHDVEEVDYSAAMESYL